MKAIRKQKSVGSCQKSGDAWLRGVLHQGWECKMQPPVLTGCSWEEPKLRDLGISTQLTLSCAAQGLRMRAVVLVRFPPPALPSSSCLLTDTCAQQGTAWNLPAASALHYPSGCIVEAKLREQVSKQELEVEGLDSWSKLAHLLARTE